MWKGIVVSAACVLMLGAGARGNIVQDQGFSVGTTNLINLLQGDQQASSTQNIVVSITQDGSGLGTTLGAAHLTALNGCIGVGAGWSGVTAMAQNLIASGLVTSSWTLHSLGDQAKLTALMNLNH
jgi:hypothetical protein